MKHYLLSSSCTGFSMTSSQPVGQCLQDAQGTYFENLCSSSGQPTANAVLRLLPLTRA